MHLYLLFTVIVLSVVEIECNTTTDSTTPILNKPLGHTFSFNYEHMTVRLSITRLDRKGRNFNSERGVTSPYDNLRLRTFRIENDDKILVALSSGLHHIILFMDESCYISKLTKGELASIHSDDGLLQVESAILSSLDNAVAIPKTDVDHHDLKYCPHDHQQFYLIHVDQ